MQFLKQIKSKALTLPIFQKKTDQRPQKQKSKNQQQAQKASKAEENKNQYSQQAYLKQVNIKSIAKAIFNKFKQDPKPLADKKQDGVGLKQDGVNNGFKQGRFWFTSPQQITKPQTTQVEVKVQLTEPEIEVTKQDATNFITNLVSSMVTYQNRKRNRINKARNQIFYNIQIQPIYMHENNIQKILKMQLQTQKSELIERTQSLVIEVNSIDRAIQSVLISGYLWNAHDKQNCEFSSKCFEIMQQNLLVVQSLQNKVRQSRKNSNILVSHLTKVTNLNKKRIILNKKIQLLKKIKTYHNDIKQSFDNIDQAFYIERSRQKLYANLFTTQLTEKIRIFQFFLQSIISRNKKLIQLLQSLFLQWIDSQAKIEPKHIQKLLILLYFTRSQKMYLANKQQVDLKKIINKQKLIQQIVAVQGWKDYRYVNDSAVKSKVKQFLQILIRQIKSYRQKSENNSQKLNQKPSKIQVTIAQNKLKLKQQNDNQIKF